MSKDLNWTLKGKRNLSLVQNDKPCISASAIFKDGAYFSSCSSPKAYFKLQVLGLTFTPATALPNTRLKWFPYWGGDRKKCNEH